MVKLSYFTSLFEVSIAIHLLYSIIPEVQEIFLAITNMRYGYFKRSIESCKRSEERFIKENNYALKDDEEKQVDRRWDKMDPEERDKIKARRIEHSKKEKEFRDVFRAIDYHRETYDMERMKLDKIAVEHQAKYIPLSLVVAMFSMMLIIIAGLFPDWEFKWHYMIFLILLVVMPMPIMIISIYCKSRKSIEIIKSAVEKLGTVIQAHTTGVFDKLPNKGM